MPPRTKREKEFEAWARRATRGIGESGTFIDLWNDKMAADPMSEPRCVMQLGLAMLLDKPIVIVAPHGAVIPENVRRVAKSVKFFNPHDLPSLEHATKAALTEAGILAEN